MTMTSPKPIARWTLADIAQLRALYPHRPTRELAVLFGRSSRSVYEKANKLWLKKTRGFLASDLAGRLNGVRGLHTRFKPGQQPWNSGLKGWRAGGRSAETRFKPGNKPHTWHPIGHERIADGGYLQKKLTDTGDTRRDYVNVHWLLWIEHHGPIPPGMLIVFKDRNPRHITIDNLECISRSENMRRNTLHRLPKEVAQAIQLVGAINRKLNRYQKETQA
jgi:hypothetical protein